MDKLSLSKTLGVLDNSKTNAIERSKKIRRYRRCRLSTLLLKMKGLLQSTSPELHILWERVVPLPSGERDTLSPHPLDAYGTSTPHFEKPGFASAR
jgi:hypothetical protein